jgi:hypothetical protein
MDFDISNKYNFKIIIQNSFVTLYVCETWSLILMEELRLKVFEKRVLGRIFGLTRKEVTG